jgi:hypothetical protein
MNADAILLALLALADLALIVHLRRRRHHHLQSRRVARSLRLAVHREVHGHMFTSPRRVLLRAS